MSATRLGLASCPDEPRSNTCPQQAALVIALVLQTQNAAMCINLAGNEARTCTDQTAASSQATQLKAHAK